MESTLMFVYTEIYRHVRSFGHFCLSLSLSFFLFSLLLYFGCVLVIFSVSHWNRLWFFNSMLHLFLYPHIYTLHININIKHQTKKILKRIQKPRCRRVQSSMGFDLRHMSVEGFFSLFLFRASFVLILFFIRSQLSGSMRYL